MALSGSCPFLSMSLPFPPSSFPLHTPSPHSSLPCVSVTTYCFVLRTSSSALVPYSVPNHFSYMDCNMSVEGLTTLICLLFSIIIFVLSILNFVPLSFGSFIHLYIEFCVSPPWHICPTWLPEALLNKVPTSFHAFCLFDIMSLNSVKLSSWTWVGHYLVGHE